ncbi:type II toxin-antitoxin system VapC family toxin [Pseudorhizobium marinum]|uniref:type II toxin-antitoxin system VapC family toxin n=1 Tax=Pseudorhizobium marinum TaxID=1496690 RepID=UPI001F2316F9|nr:type II toxin-antitoxin system VapC family toxin [Pseudorhizobium marinum]
MFIDASVIVAILAGEEDRGQLLDHLTQKERPFYVSSVVRMEASLAQTRHRAKVIGRDTPAIPDMLQESRRVVDQFLVDLQAKEAMLSGDVGSNGARCRAGVRQDRQPPCEAQCGGLFFPRLSSGLPDNGCLQGQ